MWQEREVKLEEEEEEEEHVYGMLSLHLGKVHRIII